MNLVNFGEEETSEISSLTTGFNGGGINDCQTPEGVVGTCTPLTNCPHLADMLSVPSPAILNFLRQSICGYEGYDPKVFLYLPYLCLKRVNLTAILSSCLGVLFVPNGYGKCRLIGVLLRRIHRRNTSAIRSETTGTSTATPGSA
jgi:hypothetical protein